MKHGGRRSGAGRGKTSGSGSRDWSVYKDGKKKREKAAQMHSDIRMFTQPRTNDQAYQDCQVPAEVNM